MSKVESIIQVANKAFGTGAGVAVSSPVVQRMAGNADTFTVLFGLIGVIVGVGGLLVSWYYNHKRTKILLMRLERKLDDDETD